MISTVCKDIQSGCIAVLEILSKSDYYILFQTRLKSCLKIFFAEQHVTDRLNKSSSIFHLKVLSTNHFI